MTQPPRAAYVAAPFRFELRSVELPEPGSGEVLVDVGACGICGTDVHLAVARATSFQPFGHEVAGRVAAVGDGVDHLTVGQAVALQSSGFCGHCDICRDGRVDLCRNVPGVPAGAPAHGFADRMLVRSEVVVPADGLPAAAAALAEPLGVAQDVCLTAEVSWNDDVLVVGPGPIGLMAAAVARDMGARRVVVAARSTTSRKAELAAALGADEVVAGSSLEDMGRRFGGFDRVLVTAPPSIVGEAVLAARYGGVVAYIGIAHEPGASVSFDADAFHFRKLQLRASHAVPALWLPRSLELLRRGVVPWEALVTHRFPLDEIAGAMRVAAEDRVGAVKVVVEPGARP